MTEAAGSTGEVPQDWQTVADGIFCKRDVLSGDERFVAGQLQAAAEYRVWMRWRPDVTSENRLLILGQTLNIEFVGEDGPDSEGHWLIIDCRVQKPVAVASDED